MVAAKRHKMPPNYPHECVTAVVRLRRIDRLMRSTRVSGVRQYLRAAGASTGTQEREQIVLELSTGSKISLDSFGGVTTNHPVTIVLIHTAALCPCPGCLRSYR